MYTITEFLKKFKDYFKNMIDIPSTEVQEFNHIYRAKVVDNKDPLKSGRVKVFIPKLFHKTEDNTKDGKFGIWAYPASFGWGSDKHGTLFVPPVDSYVYVFFENGDINLPRYFAGAHFKDIIPPENKYGSEYWNKWTVIKSPKGRIIIISDDPDQEFIVIKGKDSGNYIGIFEKGSASVTLCAGSNSIQVNGSSNRVEIQSSGNIVLKAPTITFHTNLIVTNNPPSRTGIAPDMPVQKPDLGG